MKSPTSSSFGLAVQALFDVSSWLGHGQDIFTTRSAGLDRHASRPTFSVHVQSFVSGRERLTMEMQSKVSQNDPVRFAIVHQRVMLAG